jgi:hypothetical protein
MKRCGTCNRTYTDPNLTYCIDDGTPLTTEFDADPPYRPPSAYVPPAAMPPGRQRRSWPWIAGTLGAFLLGVVALMIAAAIFVPRLVRSRQPVAVPSEKAQRTEQPVDPPAPAPTDEQEVLRQLTDIENEWTAANINADKKKLDRILADEYVGQAPEGGLQGKRDYLEKIQRDTITERWEFSDLKVDLSGDRATLTGKVTLLARGQDESFNFIDKFVWRNGRWQATGSEVSSTR